MQSWTIPSIKASLTTEFCSKLAVSLDFLAKNLCVIPQLPGPWENLKSTFRKLKIPVCLLGREAMSAELTPTITFWIFPPKLEKNLVKTLYMLLLEHLHTNHFHWMTKSQMLDLKVMWSHSHFVPGKNVLVITSEWTNNPIVYLYLCVTLYLMFSTLIKYIYEMPHECHTLLSLYRAMCSCINYRRCICYIPFCT